MSNRNFSCIIALLALATDAHGKLVIAAVLARSAYGKYVIAAVGDSVTAGDHGLPPFANEDEPPAPPSPFWKRLAPLFGVAAADAAAEEPQPSWSRMTPPGSTEEPSTPVDLAAAAPLPPPLLLNSPPLNEAIQSVIDPPKLRPRAGRPLTPPPKREGFDQGPSAAIATSARDVVMEPEGPRRAARVDQSSAEIDALWPADAENGNS